MQVRCVFRIFLAFFMNQKVQERESKMNKQEVYTKLQELKIGKVEVEFSGGGDEGGVDSISLIKDDDPDQIINVNLWGSKEDNPLDADLVEALSNPVYDAYGTFAGEFSVYGTLIWNAVEMKCYMKGSETVSTYEPFDNEI